MADINTRIQSKVQEIMGNEALLDMLETEAAAEMLNWGISTAQRLVGKTMELDDLAAELALLPRLKAVRQSMRAIGNWAAGKYADPADRAMLRDKLLANFKLIFGEETALPEAEKVDEVLAQVEDRNNTPQQLIGKMKLLLEELR